MKAKIYSGLRAYSQCVVDFYKMQYRDEIFERENRLILSEECRFALLALEALDDMEKGEMAKAVRAFRDALRIYPNMTSVVNEIIRYLKQDMNHPPVNAGTEFEQLAVQMKEALRGMIQAGQYEQASPVVEQLLPLLPEDLELLKMRQAILSR